MIMMHIGAELHALVNLVTIIIIMIMKNNTTLTYQ